jgi:NADPH:quinone reductase-like Zn-dependent oxidoreductase
MLAERARLRPGETLLVQGASSGVGTAAIQIGRHLGARVLACTRGVEKAERVRRLGAEQTIDPERERVAARVRSLTGGRGADVVFEHVGEATWSESVASAAYGGRIVTCGATTGRNGATNLVYLFAKELSVLGATLGSLETLRTVLGLVAEGRLAPVIDRVLPLRECRRGHEILESGAHFGKIVLRVGS